ncbi:MAG: cobalamin biosynthesis protein CobD [Ruminococcus sp.]|nr:cobalamin biosynthesis protein CobD [Ruminococcus sp.]
MNNLILAVPMLMGFFMDLILGDPYHLPHPVRLIGRWIAWLEERVRIYFSGHLFAGGVLLAVAVLLLNIAVPLVLLIVCYRLHTVLGVLAESVMCYYLIAPKCLRNESMKVYHAIVEEDIEQARKAVSMIVGRDTSVLDRNGIIRAAVETVAENTSDGVTAPILYMTIGGAVTGFFYKAVNTMDSMIGYRNEKYAELGCFAARLDDILNYIPSRLTALVMVLSAYLLKLDGRNACRIWRRDRRKHASPNSAQTESVCAGALNVRLAGDAYYFGELHKKDYIGDDIRPIEKEDILRSNRLMYCTSVLILLVSAAFRVVVIGGIIC